MHDASPAYASSFITSYINIWYALTSDRSELVKKRKRKPTKKQNKTKQTEAKLNVGPCVESTKNKNDGSGVISTPFHPRSDETFIDNDRSIDLPFFSFPINLTTEPHDAW